MNESKDKKMVNGESQADMEVVDCTWVDEEDYMLTYAWPVGLDPTAGIILSEKPRKTYGCQYGAHMCTQGHQRFG